MEIGVFFKAFLIGISVTAPLGPIGIICMQKTLSRGIVGGLITGLGAALADTFFAIVAGFGVGFVANFVEKQQFILRFAGGVILIILGAKIYYTNTIKQFRRQKIHKGGAVGDFLSVFFLTLSNPLTIIFFGAVFAGLGLVSSQGSWTSTIMLVLGVFTGALTWWVLIILLVSFFRHKIRLRSLWWINKIAGSIIAIVGIASLISLLFIRKI